MFKHYLKFFIRYFKKNALLSCINVFGLCIGIISCTFILLFILNEFSYDKFHKNYERILKVYAHYKSTDGSEQFLSGLSTNFIDRVKSQNPEVKSITGIKKGKQIVLKSDNEHVFNESNYLFTDQDFLKIFTFDIKQGSGKSDFLAPNTILITESFANKYFGYAQVVGKTLTCNDSIQLKIIGVLKDLPVNSSLNFDFLLPNAFEKRYLALNGNRRRPLSDNETGLGNFETYILINDQSEIERLSKQINNEFNTSQIFKSKVNFGLVSFKKQHLDPIDSDGSELKNIYIFTAIGFIVLILSIINYLNLSISFSFKRTRETAIRQFLGSSRSHLAAQYIFESLFLFALSFIISIFLLAIIGNTFYKAIGIEIFNGANLYLIVFLIIAGFIIIGILSSSIVFIKNLLNGASRNSNNLHYNQNNISKSQRLLTIFQFFISQTLIICSLLANEQLQFIQQKNIGLDKDNVMVIPLNPAMVNSYNAFKHDISLLSSVSGVSASTLNLFKQTPSVIQIQKFQSTDLLDVNIVTVDINFFKTVGLKWRSIPNDTSNLTSDNSIIINETAVNRLNHGNLQFKAPIDMDGTKYNVLGVIKDFNISSLKEKVQPLIITVGSDSLKAFAKYSGSMYVHFKSLANLNLAIQSVDRIYKSYNSKKPFDYYFLDSEYNRLYQSESRLSKLFNAFTGISIALACLGLFALVTFTINNKFREIGVRKILGASLGSIVLFVSKDIIKIMLYGILLAWPVAFLVTNNWLKDFAYRIDIKLSTFIIAGASMLLLTVITTARQILKATFVNPVKVLKEK